MKVIKYTVGIVAVIFFASLGISLFFCIIYPPDYVYRCLLSGVLGIEYDQIHLIKASPIPYQFSSGTSAEEIELRERFEEVFFTDNLEAYLQSNKTAAFIVVQNDRLLYERYFNGYQRDSLLPSHSVTKSLVSALVGIAISEGKIQSIEEPITRYLPELSSLDSRFSDIKIRHLLMMSSGIRFTDYLFFTSDSALTGAHPDNRYVLLHYPKIIHEPGQNFLYSDYDPQLLGLILERATGMKVANYLETRIWQLVGMEYDASWVIDSQVHEFEKMQGGFNGRAIDFVKFGRLFLSNGSWNGTTILPEPWVMESTQDIKPGGANDYYPKNDGGISKGLYYQYLWWGINRDSEASDFFAMGKYGQMIYISPSTNLIILRFGEGASKDFDKWYVAANKFTEQWRNR